MNYEQRIDECYRLNISLGLCSPSNLIGMTEDEINLVERCVQKRLPDAYRYFLKKMGKSVRSEWLSGCSFYFPFFLINERIYYGYFYSLLSNEEIKLEELKLKIKRNEFIFLAEQGCLFYFFEVSRALDQECEFQDPIVYSFDGIERINHGVTFSKWIYNHIKTHPNS